MEQVKKVLPLNIENLEGSEYNINNYLKSFKIISLTPLEEY